MKTQITLRPDGVGDIRHEMGGTDRDISSLHIGPVRRRWAAHVEAANVVARAYLGRADA